MDNSGNDREQPILDIGGNRVEKAVKKNKKKKGKIYVVEASSSSEDELMFKMDEFKEKLAKQKNEPH